VILLIRDWINIALFKKDAAEVANEATLTSGFVNYLVAGIVTFVVTLIIMFLTTVASSIGSGLGAGYGLAAGMGLILVFGFFFLILWPVGLIISLIMSALTNLLAKFLGGNGNFARTTGTIWIIGSAIALTYSLGLQIISGIIQVIAAFFGPVGALISSLFGILVIPISLAIGAISIYLESKGVGAVHNIGTLKGFIALIVPIVVLLIIVFVIVIIMLVVVGLSLQSMANPINSYFTLQ